MLRTTCLAAAFASMLATSTPAAAQGISFSIGNDPYGGYRRYYGSAVQRPYGYGERRFYDQRYYGDWRDYRGDYYRRPHYHYHAYPFPHYDLHYGRHYHGDYYRPGPRW